jgi:hypothetical protein
VDVYENDGEGLFREVTTTWIDEPHNFGMSHVIDDFDGDGAMDFFVTGMGSTTARRLDALGLGPPDRPKHNRMRGIMGYGNRMYLSRGGCFVEPSFRDQVARTGWSWGVTSFDFDNDGDRDIYVGNGHISGSSAQDYCSVFWRHDIYAGGSAPDAVLAQVFSDAHRQFGQTGSWNGFEHNCLLMNNAGRGFDEIGFLMGVAYEFDTRGIVADDIDADGLVDLLIVQRPVGRPAILHVVRNRVAEPGNWIGVRLTDEPHLATQGARVAVVAGMRTQVRQVVSGDSFNGQHAATIHWGLGRIDQVDRIEVRWPDGTVRALRQPSINTYHDVRGRR